MLQLLSSSSLFHSLILFILSPVLPEHQLIAQSIIVPYYVCFNMHTTFHFMHFTAHTGCVKCKELNFISSNRLSEALDRTSASETVLFETCYYVAPENVFTASLIQNLTKTTWFKILFRNVKRRFRKLFEIKHLEQESKLL